MKKLVNKLHNILKEKKGATLAMVLVTFTILLIIGSVFVVLGYNAYRNSYGSFCEQQANYTAESVMDNAVMEFISNENLQNAILAKLDEDIAVSDKNVPDVFVKMNVNDFKLEMGDAEIQISYYDDKKIELGFSVVAEYKGFQKKIRAKLVNNRTGANELKKIFDNAFYFKTPIVNLLCGKIEGNVYIDDPAKGKSQAEKDEIYGKVSERKIDKNGNTELIYGHTKKMQYNYYRSRNDIYKDYATRKSTNKPCEWTEVYIRSYIGGLKMTRKTSIFGDLIANTDVLLGLVDIAENGYSEHGFKESVPYDLQASWNRTKGQKTSLTALEIAGDVIVNGNVRAENLYCNNVYSTGGIFMDGSRQFAIFQWTDPTVNIEIGQKGKNNGNVFSGGDVHIENAEIWGNVYALGNVRLRNCTIHGNVFGKSINVVKKNTRIWPHADFDEQALYAGDKFDGYVNVHGRLKVLEPNKCDIDDRYVFHDVFKQKDDYQHGNMFNRSYYPDSISRKNLINFYKQIDKATNHKLTTFVNDESIDFNLKNLKIDLKNWTAPKQALDKDNVEDKHVYYEEKSLTSYYNQDKEIYEISKSAKFKNFDLSEIPNSVIKFDTTDGNIHILVEQDFKLAKNSKIILSGGNMVFFYFQSSNYTKPKMFLGKNCKVGLVEEKINQARHNDGIYFISNQNVQIKTELDSTIYGYMYMPYAIWDVAGRDKSKDPTLVGAFCVGHFATPVDFWNGVWYNNNTMYKCKKSPLIVDSDGALNLESSNNDIDFGETVWQFLGYY